MRQTLVPDTAGVAGGVLRHFPVAFGGEWRLTEELSSLLPAGLRDDNEQLVDSLAAVGLLAPVLVCGDTIIDGEERRRLLVAGGLSVVPTRSLSGHPACLYWHSNAHRPWTTIEQAWVWRLLPENERVSFCLQQGLQPSPHVALVFSFLCENPDLWPTLRQTPLPISILREAAHLGDNWQVWARFLLHLEATVGEKRVLVGLLRRCHERRVLPAEPAWPNAVTTRESLRKLAEPRLTEVQQRLREALSARPLPPAVQCRVDPVFERPGVEITLRLNRRQTQRLRDLQDQLEWLFERIPEL